MDQNDLITLKSILNYRSNTGTTIPEMKVEFEHMVGEVPLLFSQSYDEIQNYLLQIPNLQLRVMNGVNLWYSISEKSKHITEMVCNQKRVKDTNNNKCFFKDNYKYRNRQLNKWYPSSQKSSNSSGSNFSLDTYDSMSSSKGAMFHNFELCGDDFFLSMAVANLKNRYVSSRGIRKCGFCVSGQTIQQLTKRIKTAESLSSDMIINIGSVDILHGRDLLDVQDDFINLISTLENRQVNPIITTLAPLANAAHFTDVSKTLRRFNQFLKQQFSFVIDISQGFVTNQKRIIFDFFQPEATYVTGSCQPHVLWNKIGRQIVLQILSTTIADMFYDVDDC